MATRKQKIKVGAFLLLNLAVLIGSFMLISGYRRGIEVPYWIEFDETVLGLYTGGLVEYLGVPVGKVADIRVTKENKARVDIVVDPKKVVLPDGVEAKLVIYSIATGTMAISLSGGVPGTELPPGSEIPTSPSVFSSVMLQIQDMFDKLAAVAEQISTGLEGIESGELTEVVRNAQGLLTDARDLLTTTQDTVARLTEQVEPGVADFRALVNDLDALARSTRQLVETVHTKVEPLEVAETGEQLRAVLENINRLVTKLQSTAETLDTMTGAVLHEADTVEHTLRDTLRTMQETLEGVNDLMDLLKEDPSAAVRGRGKPKGGD